MKRGRILDKGFTLVELIVVIAVMSILGVSVMSFATEQMKSYTVSSTRTLLQSDLQQQLQVINDDIRNSKSVSYYNETPDANAPLTLDYPGTVGPATQQNYWRSSSNSLVIQRTPVDTSNNPIYDSGSDSGTNDYIVYYVRDGTLFRRIIPAPYANNRETIKTCTPTLAKGGCATDRKMLEGLRDGVAGFRVGYFDNAGVAIGSSSSYDGIASAASVSVTLETQTKIAGQTVNASDSAKTMFRSKISKSIKFPHSVTVGEGGISMFNTSDITLLDVATKGCISIDAGSNMGTAANPINVIAQKNALTSGTGVACGTQPILMNNNSHIYGDVCAKDQTSSVGTAGASILPGNAGTKYTQGLIPNCNPTATIALPTYDRAAHSGRMTSLKTGAQASCSNSDPAKVVEKNTKYSSTVSLTYCEEKLMGDVYIQGDLDLNLNSRLVVDETVTERPIVVVTGLIKVYYSTIVANSKGIAPYFISYKSINNACSIDANCSGISTAELAQSQSVTAIELTIGATAPSSLFNAYYSRMLVSYGTVKAGGLAAQALRLDTGTKVTLDL